MTTTTKARTARVAHRCDDCRRKTIAPGHRYLRKVMFPGDINTSPGPWTFKQCIACLSDRDETAPMLTADACASYCHGATPCARPHRHDGDHECQQCITNQRIDLLCQPADTTLPPVAPYGRRRDDVTTVHLPAHDIA